MPTSVRTLPIVEAIPTSEIPPAEAWEQRVESRLAYLGSAIARGEITAETAALAWEEWERFHTILPCLLVPDISTGPDEQVFFTWDKAEHHLVMEVFPDRAVELFYHNRATDAYWGTEGFAGDLLDPSLQERIRAC